MRVLLTRPQADSERVAAELAQDGFETLIWPMMEIRPTVSGIVIDRDTNAIAFTSANAVRIFAELSDQREIPALCVGQRTAAVAKAVGFHDVRCADGTVADLAGLVDQSGFSHILHPRGRHVAGNLGAMTHRSAIEIDDAVIYDSVPSPEPGPELSVTLLSEKIDVVSAWSPRSAQLLGAALSVHPEIDVRRSMLVAISEKTAKPLMGTGFQQVTIADRPTGSAMLRAIRDVASALRQ